MSSPTNETSEPGTSAPAAGTRMRILARTSALLHDLRGDSEKGRLLRSAGGALLLKVGATGLAFLASLLYARALGPSRYGQFAYVITCATIVTIPVALGLPQYLVREGVRAPASIRWLRRWADRRIVLSGVAACALMLAAMQLPAAGGLRWLLAIAAPLPLLLGVGSVRQSLLQAQSRIVGSQWPQLILGPTLVLATTAILWAVRGDLQPWELMLATVFAAILPIVINGAQLGRTARDADIAPSHRPTVLAALPFMWLAGLQLVQSRTDLLMLGAFRGAFDVGIYAVASRAAELLLIIGLAANTAAAPRIAALYQTGDTAQLQRLLSAMSRRVALSTAPLAIVLAVFAEPLLTLLYGEAFASGARVLQILAVAQMFAVLGGPLGTLLNMSGNERYHLFGLGVGLGLNVALNLILAPRYGAIGCATSMAISLIASRLLLLGIVRRRLAMKPTVLGI